MANVAIINPFKVAGFESKERLRSPEIKEDGIRFKMDPPRKYKNYNVFTLIRKLNTVAGSPKKMDKKKTTFLR